VGVDTVLEAWDIPRNGDITMSLGILEITFTPSEVEKITGVSTVKQRDLRRHGFLQEVEGHARFNVYDMAELLFVQKMSVRGVGPKHAFEVSGICATGIVWHALGSVDAYRGDHLTLIERGIVPDVHWGDDEVALVEHMALAAQEYGRSPEKIRDIITKPKMVQSRQAEFLQRYISHLYRGGVHPAPFFIWWADNSEIWAENLQDAFDNVPDTDPKRTGPVIILSLESLGRELLEAAKQPFFEIKVGGV
jgi:hypothetical protein